MMTAESLVLSVSDCIAFVNQTLEYAYPSVTVNGEVASFKVNQSKYVFFDIKDDQASLSCFMMVYQLRQPIEDGMKVEIVAQPKLTPWGKFSLTVRAVRPVGEGSLKKAFELLKLKLEKEGLFDEDRKRSLPEMPHHVGVISSTDAAGYADFVKIVNDRWGGMKLDVAHVQVQGAEAPLQIVRALNHFNEMAHPPEVIVIVRGGGSADDLATFNDEPLVRAIAASRVPTLVGIGHEVDLSLVDLVADVRAATPSNAAQLLVPDRRDTLNRQRLLLAQAARQVVRTFEVQEAIVKDICSEIIQEIEQKWKSSHERFAIMRRMLVQLNPRQVLQRGYAIVRTEKGLLKDELPEVGQTLRVETEKAVITTGVKDVQAK